MEIMILNKLVLFSVFGLVFFIWTAIAENKIMAKGECDKATDEIRCRYNCGPEQLQPMCVGGLCYCTNIGTGSCKAGENSEGCKSVCEFLNKTSNGCFEDECTCL